MPKRIFFFSFTLSLFLGNFILAEAVQLPLVGEAWSSVGVGQSSSIPPTPTGPLGVGWIKFSGTAQDNSTYGVLLDEATGNLSGHAWSSNAGWLSLDRRDTGSPPYGDVGERGVMGLWKFDEGEGVTASDLSGNNNNGTLTNFNFTATSGWQKTRGGSVVVLDGTDDHVRAPSTLSLNIGVSNWTVVGWLKHGPTASTRGVVSKRNFSTVTNPGYQIQLEADGGLYAYFSDGSAPRLRASSTSVLADGTWHHFAVVFDRSDRMAIYRDGIPGGSIGLTSQTGSVANTQPLYIGAADGGSPQQFFQGSIDDIRIYNRKLTTEEIERIYREGLVDETAGHWKLDEARRTLTSGLTGHWKFDEKNSFFALDSTGNGNHGILEVAGLSELVGYWRMDETSGSSTEDFTGNRRAGTLVGPPNFTSGRFGNALIFDGSDYVTIDDHPDLRLGKNMTVSAWYRWSGGGANDWRRLVGKGSSSNRNYGLWVHPLAGKVLFQIYSQNGGAACNAEVSGVTLDGDWHHLLGTYDGSQLRLYRDNTNLVNVACTLTPALSNDPITFGLANAGVAPFHSPFDGLLDDVRLYRRALNATEIQDVYSRVPPRWTSAGKVGGALDFDGLGAYVSLPRNSVSVNATLAGWFNWQSGGASLLRDYSFGGGWILAFDGAGNLNFRVASTSYSTGLTTSTVLNAWHHFALTKTGANVTYYIDGRKVASVSNAPSTASTCSTSATPICWYVMRNGRNTQYVRGKADDIRIYNRALSEKEILGLVNFVDDSSGNGNMGEVLGGAVFDADGMVGKGLKFDGVDDYIDVGDVLDIRTGSQSVAFWAKSSSFVDASIPISKGAGFAGCLSSAEDGYEVRQDANGYRFSVCKFGTAFSIASSPSFVTTDNTWHHIAAVFDRSAGTIQMYIDGAPGTAVPANFGSADIDSTRSLCFGGRCTAHKFNGILDDVRIYNRVLSQSEIQTLTDERDKPLGRYNSSLNRLDGWARFTLGAGSDSWDGWVRLGDTNYRVSRDGPDFLGYSWGGQDIVGWVSFCGGRDTTNCPGTIPYGVKIGQVDPSFSATLIADPDSGSAPLSGVDLIAQVTNPPPSFFTYRFDCESDGTYNLNSFATTSRTYTAKDLCTYNASGTYTAKVLVEQVGGILGWSVTATTTVEAISQQVYFGEPISGYAWSSNAGWISFKGTAEDGSPYGVTVDVRTGELHGHAWAGTRFSTTTATIIGDISKDGSVDGFDLAMISRADVMGSREGDPGWNYNADLDNNGLIDQRDVDILGIYFGLGSPPKTITDFSGIGWIRFDPPGPYPPAPPGVIIWPNFSARLTGFDLTNLEGWARACAVYERGCDGALRAGNTAGWDGWIKFSGRTSGAPTTSPDYQVETYVGVGDRPEKITFDSGGNVWLLNIGTAKSIARVRPWGKIDVYPMPSFYDPSDLIFAGGFLWVADHGDPTADSANPADWPRGGGIYKIALPQVVECPPPPPPCPGPEPCLIPLRPGIPGLASLESLLPGMGSLAQARPEPIICEDPPQVVGIFARFALSPNFFRPVDLASDGTYIWAVNGENFILRIDFNGNINPLSRIYLPDIDNLNCTPSCGPSTRTFIYDVLYDGTDFWAVGIGRSGPLPFDDYFLKLNKSSFAVIGRTIMDIGARDLAFDGRDLWAANGGTLFGKAAANLVTSTYSLSPAWGEKLTFDSQHGLWTSPGGIVYKVTNPTFAVPTVREFRSDGTSFAGVSRMAFDGASIWTANRNNNSVSKIFLPPPPPPAPGVPYGVQRIIVGDPPHELQGFAWGHDYFGWISFCDTAGGTHCVEVADLGRLTKITLTPIPRGGPVPLENVDLRVAVQTDAPAIPMTYSFECDINDATTTPERVIVNTTQNPYTVQDLCDYPQLGVYTSRVVVEQVGTTNSATANIVVFPTRRRECPPGAEVCP